MKAYITYRDSPSFWGLFLKKDFRHCSLVLDYESYIVFVESRHRGVSIDIQDTPTEWKKQNHISKLRSLFPTVDVFEVQPEGEHVHSIFSCVELTKRMLGINKWWIITPYQLHKYIQKEDKNNAKRSI